MNSIRTRSTRATGALLPALFAGLAAAASPFVLGRPVPVPAHAAAPVAARQDEDTAPAASSRLTGVRLPAGAVHIIDKNMTATGAGRLKRVAGAGGLSVGKTEHLAWGGENHDADRAESVKKRLTAVLESAGYDCKNAGQKKVEAGTMTFFLAVHQKKNQAVLGIWMENDSFLILNWGEISQSGDAKPADKSDENADDAAAPSEDEPASGGAG